MTQPDTLNSVAEFHATFGHPILAAPAFPPLNRCNLRLDLIEEEFLELRAAIANNDMVEVADALCDLQYVLSGTILEFGLGEKFQKLFKEVHFSNMSKSCDSPEEANETIQHYKEKGVDAYAKEVNGRFLIYRSVDDKTLKSVNYSPAEIFKILLRN